jgi:hypothetical protein
MRHDNMTRNVTDRLDFVNEAERGLLGTVPRSAAWLDAQREAVRARADYWDAMREQWDFNHSKLEGAAAPDPSARF